MNKKGFVGPIGAIFLFLLFIALWLVFLAEWLNTIGATIIATNIATLTGLEIFFYSNLNLMVFIIMVLGMLAFMYFGGGD